MGNGKAALSWAGRNDLLVPHAQWHWSQKLAQRWSDDAFSGSREITGAVRRTENVAPVFGQELIVDPVHGHGDVAAPVDVSIQRPVMVDEEALLLATATPQ